VDWLFGIGIAIEKNFDTDTDADTDSEQNGLQRAAGSLSPIAYSL
jgi:hypothetical protein